MYNSVSQVSPDFHDSILCVRLRRAWRLFSPDRRPDSLQLLFVDIQGDTILASINKELAPNYEDLIIEGYIYDLRGFQVVAKERSNEMTSSPYMIIFLDSTFIVVSDYPFFDESYFIFKPFPDILGYSTFCEGPLFDVIGAVVDIDDRLDSDGCMRLMLQDLENNRLLCRISNPFLGKLGKYPHLCKSGKLEYFVVIIQLCKKTVYKDEVCICAHNPVTDVILNSKLEEISSFISRLNFKGVKLFYDGAKFLTTLLKSGKKELGQPDKDVYSINHLSYFEEVINIWTVGTVKYIHHDMGSFYVSCPRCTREIYGPRFHMWCQSCDISLSEYAKFRVFVDVVDDRGDTCCLIIENEIATFLIESTVSSLIKSLFEFSNLPDLTESVSRLIGRELLFKVSDSEQIIVPAGVSTYDVQNCCVCPALLEHYKEKMKNNFDPSGSFSSEYSDSDSDTDYGDSSGELSDGNDDSDGDN